MAWGGKAERWSTSLEMVSSHMDYVELAHHPNKANGNVFGRKRQSEA